MLDMRCNLRFGCPVFLDDAICSIDVQIFNAIIDQLLRPYYVCLCRIIQSVRTMGGIRNSSWLTQPSPTTSGGSRANFQSVDGMSDGQGPDVDECITFLWFIFNACIEFLRAFGVTNVVVRRAWAETVWKSSLHLLRDRLRATLRRPGGSRLGLQEICYL